MAIMYITEYGGTASAGGQIQVPLEPPLALQEIPFTGTSAASAALNANTKFISLQLDAAGYIQFAASPTAVATATSRTSHKYVADVVTWHGVNSGLKVAAITA